MKIMKFLVLVLVIATFFGCNPTAKKQQDQFVLNGTLQGVSKGRVCLDYTINGQCKSDTTIIKDGKFTFTGKFPEPTFVYLRLCDKEAKTKFYVENSKMTLVGHVDSLKKAIITGSRVEDEKNMFSQGEAAVLKSYDLDPIYKELSNEKTSAKRKAELQKYIDKRSEAARLFRIEFIMKNPSSYYSAILIHGEAMDKSAEEIEKLLGMLDPSLENCSLVLELRKKIEHQRQNNVGIDKFITKASNIKYKVDDKFNGKHLTGIKYFRLFSNNNICALKKDGTVKIITPEGKEINSFKAKINGDPESLAIDKDNNIYIMSCLRENKVTKIRGKKHIERVVKDVECTMFSIKGDLISKYQINNLRSASSAEIIDDKLLISDCSLSFIGIYELKTGKVTSKVTGLRSCCSILDFSVRNKNEIIVANLGAFKVQSFDLDGKSKLGFGKRGRELNDFSGCCNPVSAASLSNGAIVTVEKNPTRVKIFSKAGAVQIQGVQDLVKGCEYIPMRVDSNDNIYLASMKKGMVKCVSIK